MQGASRGNTACTDNLTRILTLHIEVSKFDVKCFLPKVKIHYSSASLDQSLKHCTF